MTTRQAAEVWGYSMSEVQKMCRLELIPRAKKQSGRWKILENTHKPPMSCSDFSVVLDKVNMLQERAKINWELVGFSAQEVWIACEYLEGLGFLSGVKSSAKELDIFLAGAELTSNGQKLLQELKPIGKKVDVSGKVTAGPIQVEAKPKK